MVEAPEASGISIDQTLEAIAFCGSVLGPLFREDPEKGSAKQILQTLMDSDLRELAVEWPLANREIALESFMLIDEGLAAGIGDSSLIAEFRRLFVGPYRMPVPPWGSVYTDKDSVIFGFSTLELRRWMREKGIQRLSFKEEPEDHIGLMLLMMQWIAQEKPECLREYLSEHFLCWSQHFLEEFINAAQHPFYKGVALLTHATLGGVRDTLELKVPERKFYR